MQTPTPYQSIVITERHSLDTVKSIVNLKKPSVLVLKSENPSLNNRVINYSQQLITYYGWEWMKEDSKLITRHVYDKRKHKKVAMNIIEFTLKSPPELKNSSSNVDSQKTKE
jgi:hypothetical protein